MTISSYRAAWTALFLLTCSCATPQPDIFQYYSSTHGTVLILAGEKGYLGQNPAAPAPIGKDRIEELLTPLGKPHMELGSCLVYESFTFAIKTDSKEGEKYRCNGVGFLVQRCDTSRPACRRFKVRARCFDFKAGKCSPDGEMQNLTLEYVYGYDVDKGLLEVDFSPGDPSSDVLKLLGNSGYRF
jgi:hypothetical protein